MKTKKIEAETIPKLKQKNDSYLIVKHRKIPILCKRKETKKEICLDDMMKIRGHLTEDEQFIVDILWITGMRVGEAFALSDSELHERLMRHADLHENKNTCNSLLLKIGYIDRKKINRHKFSRSFKNACRQVGADCTVRNIRDTYIINIFKSDMPLALQLKSLIGHSSRQLTQAYLSHQKNNMDNILL